MWYVSRISRLFSCNVSAEYYDVIPDSKVRGANMGPTWVLSAPDGPHVGPMSLAIWDINTGKALNLHQHYDDVIMTMLASQITSLPVVCSIVYSDVNQRKHQSSASLAFVREIHRGPVNFPHKWPVTRKMFPFDDVIMSALIATLV